MFLNRFDNFDRNVGTSTKQHSLNLQFLSLNFDLLSNYLCNGSQGQKLVALLSSEILRGFVCEQLLERAWQFIIAMPNSPPHGADSSHYTAQVMCN